VRPPVGFRGGAGPTVAVLHIIRNAGLAGDLAPAVAEATGRPGQAGALADDDRAERWEVGAVERRDARELTPHEGEFQKQSVHVKFCVTIDGKCNSFDVTLSPHQNITRNVPATGTAASPKYAIDISDAEFVKSAQEKGDNLGSVRGQVDHIKSLISQAQDQQKKQAECLAQLGSLDKTGYLEQGSIKAIASGIREGRDSASMSSQHDLERMEKLVEAARKAM
jgi:hypothetical protein